MIEARQWGPACFAVYIAYDDPRGTFVDTAPTREEGIAIGEARLAEAISRDAAAMSENHPALRS